MPVHSWTYHRSMGSTDPITVDTPVVMLVVQNNTPAYVYIRVGAPGIPGAGNAEITVQPWAKVAQPLQPATMFGVNVGSAINPFPTVVPIPDCTLTFYDQYVPVAFATITPTTDPLAVSTHILLDGNVDSDTIAHPAVAGDMIYATPSGGAVVWDGLSAPGANRAVLRSLYQIPGWANGAKAHVLQGGTQVCHAGATAIQFVGTLLQEGESLYDVGLPTQFSNAVYDAWYIVGASYRFNNATATDATSYSYFQKGGAGTQYGIQNADMNAASQRRHMASALIRMLSGENVEFWIQNNSGADVTIAVAEFWIAEIF